MKTLIFFLFLILFIVNVKGQEVKSYDFDVKIEVVTKQIHVSGIVDIDFDGKDSISLVLWKNSTIHKIVMNEDVVNYQFDTISPSPIMYIPNGRNLIIYKPEKTQDKKSIQIDYACDMHELNGWANSFSEKWIELNFYCAWFPVSINSSNHTSRLKVWVDDNLKITGSGVVAKKNDYWEMVQEWGAFDIVVIASNNLKSKLLKEGDVFIETDYSELSEQDADSVLSECSFALNMYQTLFGKKDSTYLKIVIAPFDKPGGYSRKNFVSITTSEFNLNTSGIIGHEIAHFWWSAANPQTWEDWLNEAFAEYSKLIYLKERYGIELFAKRIEGYRKNSMNTPPIWGADRNSPQAYTIFYKKGAVILYDMEQKIGTEKFMDFLKTLATKKVNTTAVFLALVEENISKEMGMWIENKLKTE